MNMGDRLRIERARAGVKRTTFEAAMALRGRGFASVCFKNSYYLAPAQLPSENLKSEHKRELENWRGRCTSPSATETGRQRTAWH